MAGATSTQIGTAQRPRMEPRPDSPLFKLANKVIRFMLKRNMGPMKNVLMLVTTTGRKSGKRFTTPIGFVRDGETIVSFTMGNGESNWYRNILKNPRATLTIRGEEIEAIGKPVVGDNEVLDVFAIYSRQRPQDMERFFGVPAGSSPEVMLEAERTRVKFVRWTPVKKER